MRASDGERRKQIRTKKSIRASISLSMRGSRTACAWRPTSVFCTMCLGLSTWSRWQRRCPCPARGSSCRSTWSTLRRGARRPTTHPSALRRCSWPTRSHGAGFSSSVRARFLTHAATQHTTMVTSGPKTAIWWPSLGFCYAVIHAFIRQVRRKVYVHVAFASATA